LGIMTGMQTSNPPESALSPKRNLRRLEALRDRVRARHGGALVWRIGVTVIGVVIIAVGIVLLPLPGPGWLIIFAGLGVLATEYEWAKRLLRFARDQVQRWTDWVKRQPRVVQVVVGVLGVAFLAAIFLGVYVVLYR
jgi:uncharacterized protein (TIGR02611 family)